MRKKKSLKILKGSIGVAQLFDLTNAFEDRQESSVDYVECPTKVFDGILAPWAHGPLVVRSQRLPLARAQADSLLSEAPIDETRG